KTSSKATSSFCVRPRGNPSPPASTPTLWCFIRFRKSKCICSAPLVTKFTRGTAPEPGSSKAPNQAKIPRDRRTSLLSHKHHNHVTDHDAYSGPAAVSQTVLRPESLDPAPRCAGAPNYKKSPPTLAGPGGFERGIPLGSARRVIHASSQSPR